MAIERYLTLDKGILSFGQYFYLFILSINPIIFDLFKPFQYIFFLFGVSGSIIIHRAILPFMLFIVLDLDYSKFEEKKKLMFIFFLLASGILILFGGWA